MNHIETYAPLNRRASYELIRCRSEDGEEEFAAEVRRVEKIRATCGTEWDPVVVNLLWGDLVIERKEIL